MTVQELIQDIKEMLASAGPLESGGEIVASGLISDQSGEPKNYQVRLGLDVPMANLCDDLWGIFNTKLAKFIKDQNYNPNELLTVLNGIQVDDSHWEWLTKAILHDSEDYRWFFFMVDNIPQAACLIYHPKPSAVDGRQIFYIEYIAVAPWNRANPMEARRFQGVGTLMVTHVKNYSREVLKLEPGYCLHALPRANGFYHAIGMTQFPHMDKGPLNYFEISA